MKGQEERLCFVGEDKIGVRNVSKNVRHLVEAGTLYATRCANV